MKLKKIEVNVNHILISQNYWTMFWETFFSMGGQGGGNVC